MKRLFLLCLAGTCLPAATFAQRPDSTARRDSVHRLAPLVVSGTRLGGVTADNAPGITVTPLDVQRIPPGPSRISDALARLPGVALFNDQGNRAQPSLDVRGFTLSPVVGVPQGVSVFLDGVRINEPDAQEVNFDLIPAEAIESADLIRGASPIFGKNTLGGALNLTTIRGTTPRAEGGFSSGSYGLLDGHATVGGMLGSYDGVIVADGSREGGYQVQSGSSIRRLFATVGRRTESNDVALSLLHADNKLFEAGSLPESWLLQARRANYTGGDFYAPDATQGSLRVEHAFTSGASIRGNVFARRNAIEQFNVNVADPNTRAFVTNTSFGGTAEWQQPFSFGGLAVGAELAHSNVRYRVMDEPTASAPDLPDGCDASTGECENARVPGDDGAGYAQLTVDVTRALSLTGSLRGDAVRVPFRDLRDPTNDGTSTFSRLSPRAAIAYQPAAIASLYASFGSAFRAPAALELACAGESASCPLPFSLGADPPLAPVVALSYEAGATIGSTSARQLQVSVFRTDVHNDIVFAATSAAAGFFENLARTRRQGVEVSGSTAIEPGVRLYGSYALIDATYQSVAQLASVLDSNIVQPGSRMPLSPRHRATAGVDVSHLMRRSIWTGSFAVRATSSQFLRGDEANHTAPLPGYVVATARIGIEMPWYSLTLDADNLFDTRYSQYGIYAENPRGPIGGPVPADAPIERFLTPAYPRTISLTFTLRR